MRTPPYLSWSSVALAGLLLTTARADPEDRFHGGVFDGEASARLLQFAAGFSIRFSGGPWDGYAGGCFRQFEPLLSLQQNGPRFLGGINDGYGGGTFRQYQAASGPQSFSPRFVGGVYDGDDSSMTVGLLNPLNGDRDGDGLPDWWEARYYRSLVATDASSDTDGDHADAREEWVADTDPTDPSSSFRIVWTAMNNGSVYVTFTCSTSSVERLYDLVSFTNLNDRSGLGVPGATNVPGSVSGILTLQDEATTNAFYRVKLHLP